MLVTSQRVFFSEANALLILRQLLRCFLVNSIDQPSVRLLITQTRRQYISVKVNTFITVYRQLSLVELLRSQKIIVFYSQFGPPITSYNQNSENLNLIQLLSDDDDSDDSDNFFLPLPHLGLGRAVSGAIPGEMTDLITVVTPVCSSSAPEGLRPISLFSFALLLLFFLLGVIFCQRKGKLPLLEPTGCTRAFLDRDMLYVSSAYGPYFSSLPPSSL